ncbi:MAG: peptidoglycan-binding domain-containing protein [Egibacteraceae bacterium]
MATVKVTVDLDEIDLRKVDEDDSSTWVRGRHVDNLQGLLTATRRPAYDPKGIDGIAGPDTKKAVGRLQDEQDIDDDKRFVVGRETWEKLIEF